MPFIAVDREENRRKIQELLAENPELQEELDNFNREYEFRKKLVLARREAGLTQKEIEAKTGLAQRVISRIEKSTETSPSVRTLRKYLNAIGYELDIKRMAAE
ncbi:MAG: helix-turn-helix domain-containing protein [Clostridiales bacterium]|jgi:DNA-binding XRE family transcriptional regulator|nr:helix-turn-helix domain-containing protein [Clostridiales bacterium]